MVTKMKTLVATVVMTVSLLAMAAPAMAQQYSSSGDIYQSNNVSNSGDNSNQYVSNSQYANTGNVQNYQPACGWQYDPWFGWIWVCY